MEYRIIFYQTASGENPVIDFLESLRGRNDVLHKLVTAGLVNVFFFRPNQEIVCTHGYVKKAEKLDRGEFERAARYKADWERRHPETRGR